MRRTLLIGLLAAPGWSCGGAESVPVEPDPLPEGAIQLFSRSSFDRDFGLALATDGESVGAFFTEHDQDGHRLVFARYSRAGTRLSADTLELGGASGASATDLVFTGQEYVGIFARFTEDARTFLLRFDRDGARQGGVVALNETPLYAPGGTAGAPRGLPRLAWDAAGARVVLLWPAEVGANVVLHAGAIDLGNGRVEGRRLMDTLPETYPAPSRVMAAGDRLWFAWRERPSSGRDRLRITALDGATLEARVSGAILGREIEGAPSVAPGRVAWSGVPFSGGEAGLHLTRTSSGAAAETSRIQEGSALLALASFGAHASLFTLRPEGELSRVALASAGGAAGAGAPERWTRKAEVVDLEAVRTASTSALYWEEKRTDGVRVGVLRFFEEANDESR